MLRMLSISIFGLGLNSSAYATYASPESANVIGQADQMQTMVPMENGIYQMDAAVALVPIKSAVLSEVTVNRTSGTVTIPAKVPFVVTKARDGNVIVQPMIPNEEIGVTPDKFKFKLADLKNANPRFVMNGDVDAMYLNLSNFAPTEVAGACKTLVEQHLHFHVDGWCASQMTAGKLRQVGFTPTSCDRAILQVWTGGHASYDPIHHRKIAGCGHTAWHSGSTWTSGDLIGDPGGNYHSVGCYTRSGSGPVKHRTGDDI